MRLNPIHATTTAIALIVAVVQQRGQCASLDDMPTPGQRIVSCDDCDCGCLISMATPPYKSSNHICRPPLRSEYPIGSPTLTLQLQQCQAKPADQVPHHRAVTVFFISPLLVPVDREFDTRPWSQEQGIGQKRQIDSCLKLNT